MKKKYILSAFLSLLIGSLSSFSFAQNGNIGVDYYTTGELDIARDVFEKQTSQNPGEAFFYLGEIAYAKGDIAGAKANYEKGLAANPDYVLNNVGLGKVALKENNTKGAEDLFSTAIKKNKKDVEVIVAVARAYYANGMKDKVASTLKDAYKANNKSPLLYTFEGDMLRDANDAGGAAGQYAQANNFDPNYAPAYIKTAQVYETINGQFAIEALEKVLSLKPDYKIANKYLAHIYYKNGQYGKAISSFSTFFADGEYSVEDLTRYAASLYFTKRYDEAKKLMEEGISKDPNNFVLNRLLMYSYRDSEDYTKGLVAADKFFSLDKGTSEYIPQDYMTYGEILSKNDQLDKALIQYDKAVQLDPSQVDVYKGIAETLGSSGQPAQAAEYYKKYITLGGDEVQALDYYNMGQYYLKAAGVLYSNGTEPEKMAEYLKEADAAFGVVSERIPDSHLGFLYRAKTNTLLDPSSEKGLAKPYYEGTIDAILKKDENSTSRDLLEAYRYLTYYYYLEFEKTKSESDKQQSISYSEKILVIDPENDTAKQLLGALK